MTATNISPLLFTMIATAFFGFGFILSGVIESSKAKDIKTGDTSVNIGSGFLFIAFVLLACSI